MAFAGGLGAIVHLEHIPLGEPIKRDDFILFSESNSRFLVEVIPESKTEFEEIMSTTNLATIGRISDAKILEIYGVNGRKIVAESIGELKRVWQKPLCW
jgi:phosphoribosylformylglycinamidine synthase